MPQAIDLSASLQISDLLSRPETQVSLPDQAKRTTLAVYRITLACEGVPPELGEEAAIDIQNAFLERYPHERNVKCTFGEGRLWLVGENDHDSDGMNLIDEFSDNLCAYVGAFDGDITLVGIERVR